MGKTFRKTALLAMTITLIFAGCGKSTEDEDSEPIEEVIYEVVVSGTINGHEYVDLGLPSGTKWAICNIDATYPEDHGGFFAWGETDTKDISEFTEHYSTTTGVEMDDISGNPTYDVARAKWGGTWRMPTKDEMKELIENCTWERATATIEWYKGYKVTGPNGNSIFLPDADGYDSDTHKYGSNYWTSTPFDSDDNNTAYFLFFSNNERVVALFDRHCGFSVRAVSE